MIMQELVNIIYLNVPFLMVLQLLDKYKIAANNGCDKLICYDITCGIYLNQNIGRIYVPRSHAHQIYSNTMSSEAIINHLPIQIKMNFQIF